MAAGESIQQDLEPLTIIGEALLAEFDGDADRARAVKRIYTASPTVAVAAAMAMRELGEKSAKK